MSKHFSDQFRVSNGDPGYMRMSISTSERRVDEITMTKQEFKDVAKAIWERSPEYRGSKEVLVRFQDGMFSLSISTGTRTRTIYWISENLLIPTITQYIAEAGGV